MTLNSTSSDQQENTVDQVDAAAKVAGLLMTPTQFLFTHETKNAVLKKLLLQFPYQITASPLLYMDETMWVYNIQVNSGLLGTSNIKDYVHYTLRITFDSELNSEHSVQATATVSAADTLKVDATSKVIKIAAYTVPISKTPLSTGTGTGAGTDTDTDTDTPGNNVDADAIVLISSNPDWKKEVFDYSMACLEQEQRLMQIAMLSHCTNLFCTSAPAKSGDRIQDLTSLDLETWEEDVSYKVEFKIVATDIAPLMAYAIDQDDNYYYICVAEQQIFVYSASTFLSEELLSAFIEYGLYSTAPGNDELQAMLTI